VSQAHDLFSQYAEPQDLGFSSHDALVEGKLGHDSFRKILCNLTEINVPEELPKSLLHGVFGATSKNIDEEIDFTEFLLWFSRHGFSEMILCSKKQREIRELARKHGLTVPEIDVYKKAFDSFDGDGSGHIEIGEFEHLLHQLMKLPVHTQIPPKRLRQFWAETDIDQSGSICFEEFVVFYRKYFGRNSHEPAEAFYRSIRPCALHNASWQNH